MAPYGACAPHDGAASGVALVVEARLVVASALAALGLALDAAAVGLGGHGAFSMVTVTALSRRTTLHLTAGDA